MIFKHLFPLAFATAVLAPAAPALAESFTRIETDAAFKKQVANRQLLQGENTVTIRKNGKFSGVFGGTKYKGVWQWRDGYWCRTLTAPQENTDCQMIEVGGGKMRLTRQRGKGKVQIYSFK
ncbi:hypothetical protein TRM7557_03192 [Tritonibacter multivorans]|uniref:Dihydrodipicolinate reductase n=1 Tax=Tritonibacter multivorans TaxID=928856 RepID=A0A0P1GGM7_9RHOB|nr:hypothetical protein [Tritonibacter multivorans]MDA7420746.1 hypothetical protein [Tritonibacter multivorans]CUH81036.1 hypothetical protein TRM7557_03192 [Tritonibacter multivorans]SFC26054.1 hypothetical protein SAMN04488049_10228 [Tritonibacter multivorans]